MPPLSGTAPLLMPSHDAANFFVKSLSLRHLRQNVIDGAFLLRIDMLLERAEPLLEVLQIRREALVQRVDLLLGLRARLLLLEVLPEKFFRRPWSDDAGKPTTGFFEIGEPRH